MLCGSFNSGTRTGNRICDDVLLRDDDGVSQISRPDFAIGFADELDIPKHDRTRLTSPTEAAITTSISPVVVMGLVCRRSTSLAQRGSV